MWITDKIRTHLDTSMNMLWDANTVKLALMVCAHGGIP